MTTITVTKDDDQTIEYKFDEAQSTITLGRRSTNDVCIPDLSVSGSHATLVISEDAVVLEDLNSTNGTYVNGQVIQRTMIHPDDEIIMGKIIIGIKDLAILASDMDEGFNGGLADASDSVAEQNVIDMDDELEDEAEAESYSSISVPKSHSASGAARHANLATESVSGGAEVLDREPQKRFTTAANTAQAFSPDSKHERHTQDDNSPREPAHPLDGLEHLVVPDSTPDAPPLQEVDTPNTAAKGAVIEIKNGAKSGQILPIDKPVTTLGRPGIQIAAIMRKPHGYFLMHIESNEDSEQPTLNSNPIGDEPVPLHSGDELTVAGIDVEFMLS